MLSFRLGQTELRIHFTGVAVMTLFLLLDRTGLAGLALAACATHEAGHLICLALLRRPPACLALQWNGIRLEEPRTGLSERAWRLVLFAGSGANLCCFLLLLPWLEQVDRLGVFAAMQLVVGIYNLLPLTGLDGGRLVSRFLFRCCSPAAAEGWRRVIAAVTLAAVGFGCLKLLGGGPGGVSALVLFGSLVFTASRRTMDSD